MKKTVIAVLLSGFAMFGCSGSDAAPIPAEDPAVDNGQPLDFPSDHSADEHAGAGWPKWWNQCPGPSCDPEHKLRPDWRIDPPRANEESTGDPPRRETHKKKKPGER